MSFSSQEDAASRAEAFLRTGDTASAEVIYRQILEATPAGERLAPGLAVGSCLARRRQWPAARLHLSALVEQFPDSGVALAYLGAVKVEESDFAEGRDDLDRAIELEPDAGIVFIKRGELFQRLGLLRQAESDYQQALKISLPDQATRDYCRHVLTGVRTELKTVIERKAPPLPLLGRGIFRRKRGEKKEQLLPVSVGRSN